MLDRNVRVYSTRRANRGILRDLRRGRQALEKGKVSAPEEW